MVKVTEDEINNFIHDLATPTTILSHTLAELDKNKNDFNKLLSQAQKAILEIEKLQMEFKKKLKL